MIMKQINEIVEVSKDDLVNLLSTALYGSSYLSADYDKIFYYSIPDDKKSGDCFEEKCADVLLNGGEIYIYDGQSEGEVYSDKGIALNDRCTQYTITLDDIINGLQRSVNGTYNVCNDQKYVHDCVFALDDDFDFDFDLTDADTLMQIILFNEVIYG